MPPQGTLVEPLLRRMLKVTMARGAQSAGITTYALAASTAGATTMIGSRFRCVNGKRTDLSELLMRKARWVLAPRAVSAPQLFQGHTRFATSSIADFEGCHPHQWSARETQRYWSYDAPSAQWSASEQNVEAYITHNGDLDFFESEPRRELCPNILAPPPRPPARPSLPSK